MKIIIIGPAHPYRGGIAKFDEVLAANFVKEGHDVKIANFTLQYPSFLFPGKSQYTDSTAPTGYEIERMISSVNPFTWFSTARKIRKENPRPCNNSLLDAVFRTCIRNNCSSITLQSDRTDRQYRSS